jgi:hypothetical protein
LPGLPLDQVRYTILDLKAADKLKTLGKHLGALTLIKLKKNSEELCNQHFIAFFGLGIKFAERLLN